MIFLNIFSIIIEKFFRFVKNKIFDEMIFVNDESSKIFIKIIVVDDVIVIDIVIFIDIVILTKKKILITTNE